MLNVTLRIIRPIPYLQFNIHAVWFANTWRSVRLWQPIKISWWCSIASIVWQHSCIFWQISNKSNLKGCAQSTSPGSTRLSQGTLRGHLYEIIIGLGISPEMTEQGWLSIELQGVPRCPLLRMQLGGIGSYYNTEHEMTSETEQNNGTEQRNSKMRNGITKCETVTKTWNGSE